jgi:signal transduction histidine kinase
MANAADETKRLIESIGELTTLPAPSSFASANCPSEIIETLLDTLIRVLRLAFAQVRVTRASGGAFETLRLQEPGSHPVQPQEISQALERRLQSGPSQCPLVVPNPAGDGDVSIVRLALGLHEELGFMIAASTRPDWPTDTEMLMLRIGAAQIALVVYGTQRTDAGAEKGHRTERPRGFLGSTQTVDGKHAHRPLRALQNRFEMVVESIPDNFCALDNDWRFTYINRHAASALERIGKDPASLIGKSLWDEFPEPPNEATLRRAMAERVPIVDEIFYPPLGEWIENHIAPCTNGGLVIFARYITARKRAEQQLRRSEAYLAEGQRLSHVGTWAWDIESGRVFWSGEQFRIFGVDPQGPTPDIGMCLQFIHPDDRALIQAKLEGTLSDPHDYEWDCRIVAVDGTIKHTHTTAHPVFQAGKLAEYVGTTMDVTEQVRAAEALQKARAELAHVTRVLSVQELTTSIAHEVNQPLAAVVTNAEASLRWLDKEPPDLPEVRRAAERMIRDAKRGSAVIARTRAFLARGKGERVLIEVKDLLAEAVSLVEAEARAHEVTLRVQTSGALSPVLADRVQLQQVIVNLLINAIDAMRDVASALRLLTLDADSHSSHAVVFTVRDSGQGIGAPARQRIFDAFYTTKPDGLGLGLSISRSIVEAHGGRIWATPNADRGETFHFTIPTAESAAS